MGSINENDGSMKDYEHLEISKIEKLDNKNINQYMKNYLAINDIKYFFDLQ